MVNGNWADYGNLEEIPAQLFTDRKMSAQNRKMSAQNRKMSAQNRKMSAQNRKETNRLKARDREVTGGNWLNREWE